MEVIQIQLSPNANKSKLIEAIEMLKGVKSVIVTKSDNPINTSEGEHVKKALKLV